MPNKLTDNEIIKALEEHYIQVDKGYRTHLEYGGKGDEHEEKYIYMLCDTLDLINRQKAEIDNLNKDLADTIALNYEERKGLKAEIERLEKLLYGAENCINKIKYALEKVGHPNDRVDDALADYNLLKEMVGENNET